MRTILWQKVANDMAAINGQPVPEKNHWIPVGLTNASEQDPLFIYVGSAKVEVHTGFDPDLFADVVRLLRAL